MLFACVAAQRLSVAQIAHQLGTGIQIVRQMLTQQPKAVKQASRLADARTR